MSILFPQREKTNLTVRAVDAHTIELCTPDGDRFIGDARNLIHLITTALRNYTSPPPKHSA